MKVSVVVLTYNSYKTISMALEGIAMQNAKFEFEVIVADDGSTDMTLQTVKGYPVRIVRNKHVGVMSNFHSAIVICRGDYIAFCDGDDYWVDPYKLQKQVDYMDAHPECGLCYTNVLRKGIVEEPAPVMVPATYDSMLRGGTVSAVSVMVRNDLELALRTGKAVVMGVKQPDFFTWMHYFANYHTHMLEDITCVYVVRENSISHTKDRKERLDYIWSIMKVKMYYISKYGCKPSTFVYLWYRFGRDLLSIILKRWYK